MIKSQCCYLHAYKYVVINMFIKNYAVINMLISFTRLGF